jgi:ABC-type spermidine/putrescine transport system permease subunit I
MRVTRELPVLPAIAWIGLFFCAPVAVLFLYSLGRSTIISSTFGHSLLNYANVLKDPSLRELIWRSMWMGTVAGLACVVIAYPLVYAITLGPLRRYGPQILFLVLLSLFAAYIVRIYAWRTLLGSDGIINRALEGVGVINHPLSFLLYTRFAVILTLINVSLPFAVVPLYASLTGLDPELVAVAQSLGATPAQAFRRVTLPLSSRGIRVGFALCCIGAAGDYVTPQLVGDPNSQLAGTSISNYFGVDFNWAAGSALAFLLVLAVALCVLAVFAAMRVAGLKERPA